jgi:hypothetical protein
MPAKKQWDPILGPEWYESFSRTQIPAQYGGKKKKTLGDRSGPAGMFKH